MNDSKYLFVTYESSDYEKIDNVFLELYKNGIAVKDAKDADRTETDSMIADAEAVLFVISPGSVSSPQIQYYLGLADQYNKHIIPYYLCPPEYSGISRRMLMKMDGSAAIPAYEYATETDLIQRMLEELRPYFPEAFETVKKKNPFIGIAVVSVLLCAFMAVYFAWIKPAQQEKALNNVRNSTVKIYTLDADFDAYNNGDDDFLSYLGVGSGFFIEAEGLIATNYHVIEGGTVFGVIPASAPGKVHIASLVSYDEAADLALLQMDDDYTVTNFLTLSNRKVNTGDVIYVSGYPRDIDLTLSNGIVSNEKHYTSYESDYYYYLITAAVSPGNSGGPVVDSSGSVIGIATAKYVDAENVNLVRPAEYLKELMKRAKQNK